MNDKKPLMDYRRVQKLQTPLLLTGALLSGVGTSVSVPLVILGIAIMLFAIVIGVLYYRCPHCGRPMTMNLRCDDKFAEDEGWHAAAERYENFLRTRDGQKILFLELGVGYNTPVIIKYPFLRMTAGNPKATYACINMGQASTLREIEERSILIDGDIAAVIEEMKKTASYK